MPVTAVEDCANWCLDTAVALLDEAEGVLAAPSDRRIHFGRGDGGEVPWGDCCSSYGDRIGGQLVVAVGTIQPTTKFPVAETGLINCAMAHRVPIAVEVVRCMPQMNNGATVDTAALQADAELRMREGWALLCGFEKALGPRTYKASIGGLSSAESTCKSVRLAMTFQL